MLRTAVSSSSLRRITAAASTTSINKFLSPSVAPAIVVAPCSPDLAAYSSKASPLLFLSFPGQTRGYARGRPVPSNDNDLFDGGDDSEDFLSDGDDKDEDKDDLDEDSLDVDYVIGDESD